MNGFLGVIKTFSEWVDFDFVSLIQVKLKSGMWFNLIYKGLDFVLITRKLSSK